MATPTPTDLTVIGAGMPQGAVPAAAIVLVYSFLCLSCGLLLVTVLLLNKERATYVLLFAISTTCSTTVSISQQIYYIARWKQSRIEAYEVAVAAVRNPALALGPISKGYSRVSYWIQVYLFNVDALLMLFWAIALTFSIWDWRIRSIKPHNSRVGIASKIAAFLLPAIVTALRSTTQVNIQFAPGLVLNSCLLFISFTFGACCVFLILIKYIRTRLGFTSYASGSINIDNINTSGSRDGRSRMRVRVDPWLVLRFSIAFFILSGFNIFLVMYSIGRYNKIKGDGYKPAPNFSTRIAVQDVLNYIPPVTASMLAFLLFGTTSQARAKYADIFGPICCCCARRRIPTSSRLRGSSVTDWDPISERRGGSVSTSKSPELDMYELDETALPKLPPKATPPQDNPQILITSDVLVTRSIPGP